MNDSQTPQPMRPHGLAGRIFAAVMERMNEKAYRWTIAQLKSAKPQCLFELGFGTGRCLELAGSTLPLKEVCGVDPSPLMVDQATKRMRKFKRTITADLRQGDDTSDFWPSRRFDAMIALHSFQFWPEPTATLERLRRQLSPQGRLVLVLRSHGKTPPAWLPNPISRSADELSGTKAALAAAGFTVIADEALDAASHGLVSC